MSFIAKHAQSCHNHLCKTYTLVWVVGCVTVHQLLSGQRGNTVSCYCPLPLYVPYGAECPASPHCPLVLHARNYSFFSPVKWGREWCGGRGGETVAIQGKHRRGARAHEYLLLKLSWTHVCKLVQRKGHITGVKQRDKTILHHMLISHVILKNPYELCLPSWCLECVCRYIPSWD